MAYSYTEREKDALNKKLQSPNNVVLCPRCGTPIEYERIGNSIKVACQTADCLKGGLRGL
jgi:hypothetical protein